MIFKSIEDLHNQGYEITGYDILNQKTITLSNSEDVSKKLTRTAKINGHNLHVHVVKIN